LSQRYIACMILGGVGDALGYNNGRFEFNYSGISIHEEVEKNGGIEKMDVSSKKVSDDTVMHLATASALCSSFKDEKELCNNIAKEYVLSFEDMDGRAPGEVTLAAIDRLKKGSNWDEIPYNGKGGGCGGSMRAMCIGLRFPGESQRDKLIAISIESGRITHNHPTGFLGAFVSALFTAFAIEGYPVGSWGRQMLKLLPKCYQYLESSKRNWNDYQKDLNYFENQWRKYLKLRGILKGNKPKYPTEYDVKERDEFYKSLSFDGWGGSSGHDSVIIAYDALLVAVSTKSWKKLIENAVLHGGDNDSTGSIAASWFGALFGLEEVPSNHYEELEYRDRLHSSALQLFELSKQLLQSEETTTNSNKKRRKKK